MNLEIKSASMADSDFLFELRNDPLTRQMSKNQSPVAPDEHRRWLEKQLSSKDSRLWVAWLEGRRMGQFRVSAGGIAGVAIAPPYRGQGWMSRLVSAGSKSAHAELGFERIEAHIRVDNLSSVRGFQRAGYQKTSTFSEDGSEYFRLEWLNAGREPVS